MTAPFYVLFWLSCWLVAIVLLPLMLLYYSLQRPLSWLATRLAT